jgi:hypothetical protein
MNACQAGGVSVWHAENLDVDALLESCGQRVGEGVLWLGHCIYTGLADDARHRDTGRVPLRAEYLRNVIGRHHLAAVRKAAMAIGYVDRDPSYRAGSHSQAYWILPPYDRALLVRRQITDPGLRLNIRKWCEARRRAMWQRIQRNETPVDAAVCEHLWRHLQRVRIDPNVCFGDATLSEHQVSTYQMAVEHLRHRELRFTVDEHGRIHTNLTSLPKTLRKYLTVEGKHLVNIDISESQPLFLGVALARINREFLPTERERSRKEEREEGNRPPSLMMDNTMMDTRPQLAGEVNRTLLSSDLRRYIEHCESRGLYQAVANRLGKTRDQAKKRVMVAFFDKPGRPNAAFQVLAQLFPTVMQAVRRMKQGNYCRLAHFAQRIESAFMFGRVVPRIMELRPDLFISTIHDSILTPVGEAEFVRQVMLDEFARLGLSPQVKVELCCKTR